MNDETNVVGTGNFPQKPETPAIPIREAVFAWVFYLLSFVFTHFAYRYAGGIWGGIFWSVIGVVGAVYIKLNRLPVKKSHIVIFAAAEIFCLTPLFCTNYIVNFLAAVFSFVLYFYLLLCISGAELFGNHFVIDTLRSVFLQPFIRFTAQLRCAFSVFRGKNRSKNVLFALLGLVAAIPLTVAVVILLMNSDELFESSVKGVLDNFTGISFSLFWELIFAVPIAMYLFGAVFGAKSDVYHACDEAPGYRFLPPVFAYSTVTPACIFYFIYIVMQFSRIADVNKFEYAANFSEFARRGFFELCLIAVINLIVIIVMQAFTKRKKDDKRSAPLKIYTIIICVLTLLIIATAIAKMLIYIGELGMTPLRVYTTWFMLLLSLVFVLIIIWQLKEFKLWKVLFAGFAIFFAIPCFGNLEGMIANYNISAYESGVIRELDVDVLYLVGFSGAGPAKELLDSGKGSDSVRQKLENYLSFESDIHNKMDQFAYFSIPRAAAEKSLR